MKTWSRYVGICCITVLLFSVAAYGQKQLTDAEVQEFYGLVRQTKEFKRMKEGADSVNAKRPNDVPQQVDLHIVKKEPGAPDDHMFSAVLERMVMGVPLEKYFIDYNNQKKQFVSVRKEHTGFQVN